jgi:hypothetical protein
MYGELLVFIHVYLYVYICNEKNAPDYERLKISEKETLMARFKASGTRQYPNYKYMFMHRSPDMYIWIYIYPYEPIHMALCMYMYVHMHVCIKRY